MHYALLLRKVAEIKMENFFVKYCSLYKSWNNREINKWQESKQKGVISFVFIEGVVRYGIWACAAFVLMLYFRNDLTIKSFSTACMTWFIGSIVYGYLYWVGTSLSYRKFQEIKKHNQ